MNMQHPHTESSPDRATLRPRSVLTTTSVLIGVLIVVAASLGLPSGGRAEQAKALVQVDVAASSKSFFIDDPNFGKDPFFPNSKRRIQTVVSTNAFVEVSIPDLILKGISGTRDRRLALINNYTIGVGEQVEMRIGSQVIPIRCLEIREKTVVVENRGQTKELRLRQGL